MLDKEATQISRMARRRIWYLNCGNIHAGDAATLDVPTSVSEGIKPKLQPLQAWSHTACLRASVDSRPIRSAYIWRDASRLRKTVDIRSRIALQD